MVVLHVSTVPIIHPTSLIGPDTEETIDFKDYPEGASILLVMDMDSVHQAITVIDKSGVHLVSI